MTFFHLKVSSASFVIDPITPTRGYLETALITQAISQISLASLSGKLWAPQKN